MEGMGCWIEIQCSGLKLDVKVLSGFLLKKGNCGIQHRILSKQTATFYLAFLLSVSFYPNFWFGSPDQKKGFACVFVYLLLVSLLLTLFTPCSSVSIVNYVQVN